MVTHRVQTLDVSFQKGVLALDPIFNQFLELFKLNSHNDVVDLLVGALLLFFIGGIRVKLLVKVALAVLDLIIKETFQVAVAELTDLAWWQIFKLLLLFLQKFNYVLQKFGHHRIR